MSLNRNQERDYRHFEAYIMLNTAIDPKFFILDLYKTGWRGAQRRADVKAERTAEKVEARQQAALRLGLGDKI